MSIEAMKLALEALEECRRDPRLKYEHPIYDKTIIALRQAIHAATQREQAQPSRSNIKQSVSVEPMAHWSDCAVHSEPAYPKGECDCGGYVPPTPSPATAEDMEIYKAIADNYTSPPPVAEPHKPLTDEQIEELMDTYDVASIDYARAIEAAHGIGEQK